MKPARRRREQKRPPVPGTEQIDIRTSDGWSLRADVHEPERAPAGTVVLAHALMARRTEFERPSGAGLAQFFVGHGWRVVATFGYDDYVMRDLPAVYAFARARGPRKRPVVLVGHSLGGHVAFAAQGAGLVAFDGLVSVAGNVWLRELEPSSVLWLIKRAALFAARAVGQRLGRFPARALGLGSDDESCASLDDVERFARTGRWESADGRVDYLSSLSRVQVPVLQMVSDGDRFECSPECGARFVAHCGGRYEILRIARSDDGGPPPDHMGLVTSGRARSAWEQAEAWMRACPSSVIRPSDSSRT
jgi:predicted alpha/beta hydrolase